jgi:hypothetical protein
MPDAGGGSRKKSLAMILAVMCGGVERTQDVSLWAKCGTRFVRTTRSESTHSHNSKLRHEERRRPSIVPYACGISTLPIKNSPHPALYTRNSGADAASRRDPSSPVEWSPPALDRARSVLQQTTAGRRRQCIRSNSAYRRALPPAWAQRFGS